MTPLNASTFKIDFESHQQHLKLKGLQPKTIDAYTRAMARIGQYFNYQVDDLSECQLTDYFTHLLKTHSWSTVKLDLYGLKFFYQHVLKKSWKHVDLIKPPRATRIPDIVSIEEALRLFAATNKLSYRVFFFTTYSMGLRLGEGLRLSIGDIDAQRQRVLIRNAKGNKDRFVPLPAMTLNVLRRFWSIHRNPILLFPNRKGGLKGSASALTPLDKGGVQAALRKVVISCGLKKRLHPTA
jgi:site-specific recombinase XerD